MFVSQLKAHIIDLDSRLINDSYDEESRSSLHYSCIVSWTNYAHVRYLLATSPSTSHSSASIYCYECNGALQRVIRLVGQLKRYDFLALEALLGVRQTLGISETCSDT